MVSSFRFCAHMWHAQGLLSKKKVRTFHSVACIGASACGLCIKGGCAYSTVLSHTSKCMRMIVMCIYVCICFEAGEPM
jgi:hypothetical protein